MLIAVLTLMAPASAVGADQASSAEDGSSEQVSSRDLPDVAPPQIDDPVSEAELEDLKTYASQEGMSLQVAIDQYAWRDNFALAVNAIQEMYPETFAGAQIVGPRAAWVGFAAKVPDTAISSFNSFEKTYPAVAVDVRPDFGFSDVGRDSWRRSDP